MQKIFTPNAPAPAGHYSQAIIYGNLVFISGQLPINPKSEEKTIGTIEEQTEQVLKNLGEILQAAGSNPEMVIKTTIYISDINLWDRVNKLYSNFFGNHKPARAVVPTTELHFGFQIELDAIAAIRKQTNK